MQSRTDLSQELLLLSQLSLIEWSSIVYLCLFLLTFAFTFWTRVRIDRHLVAYAFTCYKHEIFREQKYAIYLRWKSTDVLTETRKFPYQGARRDVGGKTGSPECLAASADVALWVLSAPTLEELRESKRLPRSWLCALASAAQSNPRT